MFSGTPCTIAVYPDFKKKNLKKNSKDNLLLFKLCIFPGGGLRRKGSKMGGEGFKIVL